MFVLPKQPQVVVVSNASKSNAWVEEMVELVVSKNKSPKKARLVELIFSPFTKISILLQYATIYSIC